MQGSDLCRVSRRMRARRLSAQARAFLCASNRRTPALGARQGARRLGDRAAACDDLFSLCTRALLLCVRLLPSRGAWIPRVVLTSDQLPATQHAHWPASACPWHPATKLAVVDELMPSWPAPCHAFISRLLSVFLPLTHASHLPRPTSFPPSDPSQEIPSRHLYVGNLSTTTSEAELRRLFAPFQPESVTVLTNRCYGFVNFYTVAASIRASQAMQGYMAYGRSMRIEYARGGKPTRFLEVVNIGPTQSRETLLAIFEPFGQIEDIDYRPAPGQAFVDFKVCSSALIALCTCRSADARATSYGNSGRSTPWRRTPACRARTWAPARALRWSSCHALGRPVRFSERRRLPRQLRPSRA